MIHFATWFFRAIHARWDKVAFAAALLAASLVVHSPPAAVAEFFDLAAFTPRAVSADGSVVVGDGFRWTRSDRSILPLEGTAQAVSHDGDVIAGVTRSPTAPTEAFRWTASTGLVRLGKLAGGSAAYGSEGLAVSGDGSVIVGTSSSARSNPYEAFRWTSPTGMVGLGDLAGGFFHSAASGISSDGSVIVGAGATAATRQMAFRWTASSGFAELGDLPGGTLNSYATGVSGDGSVVVGYSSSTASAANPPQGGRIFWEAWRWTPTEGLVGLGDLPGGAFDSQAWGISGDGSRIVGSSDTAGNSINNRVFEAFLWDNAHGMRRLQDVLTNEYGLGSALAGWRLSTATAISFDGMTIVGNGINPAGQNAGWVVNLNPVPEPSSIALFALPAILFLLLLRRRGTSSCCN